MLPHVIAYNASVPTKFMPSPNQRAYVAHKKYAMMADLLGLGGDTVDEKVQNLVTASGGTAGPAGIPRSIADLGISKEEFERGHARSGEDRLRRSLVALESAHAAGERIGGTVLEGLPGPRRSEDCRGFRTVHSEGMVVRMTTNAMWIQVDSEHTEALRDEAIERLTRAEGDVVLDFSSVKRLDVDSVRLLEELAGLADEKSVKLVLRAVNMDIYRVLKLLKLAERFTVLT